MLRLAILAPTYLPSRRANTIQVMKMAEAFTRLGHSIHLFVPLPKRAHGSRPDWPDLAQHYGLSAAKFPITWLPVKSIWRSYDYGLSAVRNARAWKADLIYTRHPQAAAFASLAGRPVILEAHDVPGGLAGAWLFRIFLRGRGARRLVAISRVLGADLGRRFPIPDDSFLLTAPDGVDIERYAGLPDPPAARAALALPEQFTAGYTGHLYAGRGIEHILELAAARPGIHFLLVGGNPVDIRRVRARASGLSNVTLTGFIPNADLPRYQAACDVLLMPYQRHVSASSGGDIAPYLSPLKLFEYLACGRPILSSDLPVLQEVLDERRAILLPPDDLAAWSAALDRLAEDPGRRLAFGARAREEAAKYTWLRRAQNILAGLG